MPTGSEPSLRDPPRTPPLRPEIRSCVTTNCQLKRRDAGFQRVQLVLGLGDRLGAADGVAVVDEGVLASGLWRRSNVRSAHINERLADAAPGAAAGVSGPLDPAFNTAYGYLPNVWLPGLARAASEQSYSEGEKATMAKAPDPSTKEGRLTIAPKSVTHESSAVLGPELPVAPDDDPFRLELRTWLQEARPGVEEPLDLNERFAFGRAWQRTLFEGGWAGPAWPRRFGGRDATAIQQYMYYEELALARVPEPVNTPGIILLGPTLMVYGSEELQERFLPGILSGEEIWCQAFSEPDAGSDLASLRTRARLDADRWVIDGQKVWTTWAMQAEWCFLLCRTDPNSSRHRGLTLLIVHMDQAGVTRRPIVQMSGDSEFGEVFFEAAETEVDLTVGAPGEGWRASMTMFGFERADQGFTDHARLLVTLADLGRQLRQEAEQGTLRGAQLETARVEFADLWIRCQQLRRMNLRMALHLDQGNEIGLAGSPTNLFWGELTKAVAEFAARVNGVEGLLKGTHASHHLLSSRAASIYSGTSEIQRNIIAERILGLPR